MVFNDTTMKTKIQKYFNEMYKNNPKIDQISNNDLNYYRLSKHLRQALYYEIYPDSSYEVLKTAPELPLDKKAVAFITNLQNATVLDTDRKFTLIKMMLMVKHFSKDVNYDMSETCTDDMIRNLNQVLIELPSLQPHQTIFTINALFSSQEIIIETVITPQKLKIRQIQQRINRYFTSTEHLQLAYTMGIISPNGRKTPSMPIENQNYNPKRYVYKIIVDLSLMFQDIIGWAPLILQYLPITNALPIQLSPQAVQCVKDAYYILNDEELLTNNPSESIIRRVFEWYPSKIKNLQMNSMAHLMLNKPNAVQAFDLDTSDSNNYKIYTLQYFTSSNQEKIKIGHFNPNINDDWYHTPRCQFDSTTITLGSSIAAHSQTLAPINSSHTKFFVGISPNTQSKTEPWAQKLGVISINGKSLYSKEQDMPYLYGFNAYRLEAITDFKHNLLIVQNITKDSSMIFTQYKLSSIVSYLETHENADINHFNPINHSIVNNVRDHINSFQGFSYDYNRNRIIISSQHHPTELEIDPDRTLFLPDYKTPRALYIIPWNNTSFDNWKRITLTNLQGTSIQDAINQQTNDYFKPIQYATEIESNLLASNNSIYQIITYHWSDKMLLKQDNTNSLVKISWDDLS